MSNKKISACVFPVTVPVDELVLPLVHIFSELVYFQPVEMGEEEIGTADYLRVHVPAPLGEEKERFLNLLSDMHGRSADYTEQFKHLVLSGIGQGKPETKSSIISKLRNSAGMDNIKGEELRLLLWQTRLVLSLGEFIDKEQQELIRELAKINEREKVLFAELRVDNNKHPFDLTKTIIETTGQASDLKLLRLKAWSRLFCLGSNPLNSVDCFVTSERDAIDMMVEVYEKLFGSSVQPFITLSLPALTTTASMQSDKIKQLQQVDLPVILSQVFSGSTGRKSNIEYDYKTLQADWEKIVENLYPLADTERLNLYIYKFPDIRPGDLFMESFGGEGGQIRLEKENQRAGKETIICWLESGTECL
jgi:hypothetical protein